MSIKQRILNPQPLIVSYSYSGNTNRVARIIQELTGGDVSEIYPWQPYPMAFPELLKQVKKEVARGYYPALLPGVSTPTQYRVIFAGSPNWCGSIAPPLASWLYKNDLSGKIILPFYSHCGGVPADFRNDIKNICPGSDVREPLNVIGDGGGQIEDVVEIWLQENGIMES